MVLGTVSIFSSVDYVEHLNACIKRVQYFEDIEWYHQENSMEKQFSIEVESKFFRFLISTIGDWKIWSMIFQSVQYLNNASPILSFLQSLWDHSSDNDTFTTQSLNCFFPLLFLSLYAPIALDFVSWWYVPQAVVS